MKKIAVIGSINMDLTAVAERIPLKGETISASSMQYIPGGKGANQAVAAARLGGNVTMYGCVGDDAFGKALINNLQANCVGTECIEIIQGKSSGLAMIVVAESDNVITVIPGANECVTAEYIDRHLKQIKEADIILLQNEIPFDSVRHAVKVLSEWGKTIIYNPAPAMKLDDFVTKRITYLTPNEHEARIVLDDYDSSLVKMLKQYEKKLIVTMGSQGVITAENGNIIRVRAIQTDVVDTTGAGDTMNGAFALALSMDMTLEAALTFANAAAGLSTEKAGAQTGMPTYEEVISIIESQKE